jgi:hypothetical protein
MGIILNVKIRCFKVKDLTKVDLEVLNEEPNHKAYKAKLSAYYYASFDNLYKELHQCSVSCRGVDPGGKQNYTLINIYISYGINVIAFANNACGSYRPNCYYQVQFFNVCKNLIEEKEIRATSECNYFMVLVPPEAFFMDYVIGKYKHDCEFGKKFFYNQRNLQIDFCSRKVTLKIE